MQNLEIDFTTIAEKLAEHAVVTALVAGVTTAVAASASFFEHTSCLTSLELEQPPPPRELPTDDMLESDLVRPLFRSEYVVRSGTDSASYYQMFGDYLTQSSLPTTLNICISMCNTGLIPLQPGVVEQFTRLRDSNHARFEYIIIPRGNETPQQLERFRKQYPFADKMGFVTDTKTLPPAWLRTSFVVGDSPTFAATHKRKAGARIHSYCTYHDSRVVKLLAKRFNALLWQSAIPEAIPLVARPARPLAPKRNGTRSPEMRSQQKKGVGRATSRRKAS